MYLEYYFLRCLLLFPSDFFILLTAHTVRYDMAALSFICSANWDVTHKLLLKRVNSWRALTFPCCPNILDVFLM